MAMSSAPEQKARKKIDRLLTQCGWIVQDYDEMNLSARAGLADGLDSAGIRSSSAGWSRQPRRREGPFSRLRIFFALGGALMVKRAPYGTDAAGLGAVGAKARRWDDRRDRLPAWRRGGRAACWQTV